MPADVKMYSLLISCPSDVAAYLDDIKRAVESFNHAYGKQNGIVVETLHWSRDTYSNMAQDTTAQGEINRQLLSESDMLIGVFWTRFGKPTAKYGSGTEEEINYMLEKKKPVILYFLDKPVSPSSVDTEQLKKINDFKEKHKDEGLYRVLKNEVDLALTLREELELRFREMLKKGNRAAANTPPPAEEPPKAKTILWVDDHPENHVPGMRFFENNGIEVLPALSTKQALRILENNEVSAIISNMERKEGPEEGYKLLEELRQTGNKTPFFLFAGSRAKDQIEETLRRGGQGATNNYEELFSMVTAVLLGTFVEQSVY